MYNAKIKNSYILTFNMDRWQNKVAVVTGASSGIGAKVAKDLVEAGLIVVALARRYEKIQKLRESLSSDQQSRLYPQKCDVTKEPEVMQVFKWIESNLGGTDILVNNAGIGEIGLRLTSPGNSTRIQEIVDTNIMGAVYYVREAFASMKQRGSDGHVLIVNSILGHNVWNQNMCGFVNIYPGTKFAITAMTETYRQEFANAGTKVKITSISPGLVDTDILSDEIRQTKEILKPEDISNAIMYCISTPPHVQIHELTIKPVGEPF